MMTSVRLTYPYAAAAAAGVALAYVAWRRRRRRGPQLSLTALRDNLALRQAFQSRIGLDIGGTLAKLVFLSNKELLDRLSLSEDATVHSALSFSLSKGDSTLHFVILPTDMLEATCRSIHNRMSWPAADQSVRRIVAAGGGAIRFREMFHDVLQVQLLPFKELQAVVEGLLFLSAQGPAHDELFTIDPSSSSPSSGREVSVPWPTTEPLFPFLLVNMGSGRVLLGATTDSRTAAPRRRDLPRPCARLDRQATSSG